MKTVATMCGTVSIQNHGNGSLTLSVNGSDTVIDGNELKSVLNRALEG